jgi:ribosomal protein S27AE
MKNNDPKTCPSCQKQAFLYIIKDGKQERINTACPICSMVHDELRGWVFYPFFKK